MELEIFTLNEISQTQKELFSGKFTETVGELPSLRISSQKAREILGCENPERRSAEHCPRTCWRWKWAQSIIFQPQSHFKWVSNLGFQTWTACSLHQQHHAASWAAGFWGILDSDHSQEGNWALTPVSYCLTSSLVFAVLYLFQSLNLKN